MLAGVLGAGEAGSKGGGGPVTLSDVDTWELAGFQNELNFITLEGKKLNY